MAGISSPAESGVTRPCRSRITYSFTSRHCVTGSSLPSKIGTTGLTSCVHCNEKNISSKCIMHALTGSLSNSLTARNILFLQGQSRGFCTYLLSTCDKRLDFRLKYRCLGSGVYFIFFKKLVSQLTEVVQKLKIIPSIGQKLSMFSFTFHLRTKNHKVFKTVWCFGLHSGTK
jgi:hypothetical protein